MKALLLILFLTATVQSNFLNRIYYRVFTHNSEESRQLLHGFFDHLGLFELYLGATDLECFEVTPEITEKTILLVKNLESLSTVPANYAALHQQVTQSVENLGSLINSSINKSCQPEQKALIDAFVAAYSYSFQLLNDPKSFNQKKWGKASAAVVEFASEFSSLINSHLYEKAGKSAAKLAVELIKLN